MSICSKPVFPFPILASLLVAVGLITPAPLVSQLANSLSDSVVGVVRQEHGGSMAGFRVELSNTGGWETTWAEVRPDGSFQLSPRANAGRQYILRVVDGRGRVVHDDIVRPDSGPLEIHLQGDRQERPVNGVISLEELRNLPPKKALREYRRAEEAMRKGDVQRATRHLRKAIKIHPQFVEAHNSLGVKYMALQDYSQAATAFEAAVKLRPQAAQPLSNLGIAYHGLGRYDEAERLIRSALELGPGAPKTRFSLALVLLSKGKDLEEASEILLDVATEIPQSHLCLATFYEGQRKYWDAAREVTAYLNTEDRQFRQIAEEWLGRLQPDANQTRTAAIGP